MLKVIAKYPANAKTVHLNDKVHVDCGCDFVLIDDSRYMFIAEDNFAFANFNGRHVSEYE